MRSPDSELRPVIEVDGEPRGRRRPRTARSSRFRPSPRGTTLHRRRMATQLGPAIAGAHTNALSPGGILVAASGGSIARYDTDNDGAGGPVRRRPRRHQHAAVQPRRVDPAGDVARSDGVGLRRRHRHPSRRPDSVGCPVHLSRGSCVPMAEPSPSPTPPASPSGTSTRSTWWPRPASSPAATLRPPSGRRTCPTSASTVRPVPSLRDGRIAHESPSGQVSVSGGMPSSSLIARISSRYAALAGSLSSSA